MILIFDDEKSVRENFKKELSGQNVAREIVESDSLKDLQEKLANPGLMQRVKVLVFDLSTSREEAESRKFAVLEDIKANYEHYSLPIFIHSAFSDLVEGYDEIGTVFKIKKGADSIQNISGRIKLFDESGFLDIFCPNGYLQMEIHKEIHKAFNSQFHGEEISEIIKSIASVPGDKNVERTRAVFQRIAIRALYQNLISAKKIAETNLVEEIRINAVEHYYRRTSDFEVWTGDIWEDAERKQLVILTPRCDINNGACKQRYLVCKVDELDQELIRKITRDVNKYLTDNPQQSGIKSRFLIPAPNYRGGKVDLSEYLILPNEYFTGENKRYSYLISLSDELTNEIVRKFASYILRGGISASDITEATFYSNNSKA